MSGVSSPEAIISLTMKNDLGWVADYITQNTVLKYMDKQRILETVDNSKRLRAVCSILAREIEVLGIEKDINEKLYANMIKEQRNNVLHEQMRIIQSELGEGEFSDLMNTDRK